ncbi:MAG: integrase [Candidatus Staskawiczbacteria bacterium]|nr:integrase [Candidatus Staskawiczbacteria bacterium]
MIINMQDDDVVSIDQVKEFLKLNSEATMFLAENKAERNLWIENVLNKFGYFSCRKKDKTIVKKYIARMTGLSETQTKKLVSKKKKFGKIIVAYSNCRRFPTKYDASDIALLIRTDNLHGRLSGLATKGILVREYNTFSKQDYRNISNVSASHIYNLRATRQYVSHSVTVKKTNPVKILIGRRTKPENNGLPGFLRVDTVHQGDLDKEKGIYHINIVDEVTQWEIIGCVERISEEYLLPLLEDLLSQFPFSIINFHSDNGSEYINKVVAELLNKLLISQTKSRPRHSNDNGLVEGKNNFIIRKHIGYRFIAKGYAKHFNEFYKSCFNDYLNFHRPCGYPTITTDKRGKEKKIYKTYLTPYAKLKSLKNAKQYLKPNVTFTDLDKIALSSSDNEFAGFMQKEKEKLFNNFKGQKLQFPTTFSNKVMSEISGSFLD